MKIRDLIQRLTTIADDLEASLGTDIEPEVVCAIDPSRPRAVTVEAVVLVEDDDAELIGGHPIVWLATGALPLGLSARAAFEVER